MTMLNNNDIEWEAQVRGTLYYLGMENTLRLVCKKEKSW